jgi:hypothetical protein
MSSFSTGVKRFLPKLALVAIFALLALPVSVAAVYLGRGSVEHFMLAVAPALLAAPLLAIWGIALWVVTLRVDDPALKGRMQWIGAIMLGLSQLFVLVAPSYLPGLLLNQRDVHAAQSYCETLMPRLESYREANGAYPDSVESLLPKDRPVPRLLRKTEFYRPIGAGFEFAFQDPSPLIGGHTYFSSDRRPGGRWEHWF